MRSLTFSRAHRGRGWRSFFILIKSPRTARSSTNANRSPRERDWTPGACVQPHWKRIRRRICWGCARQVALTEPRYLVCAGCGKARYCSEACQRADWPRHQHKCPAVAFSHYWDPRFDREGMIRRCKENISTWTRETIQEFKYRNQHPGMEIRPQF